MLVNSITSEQTAETFQAVAKSYIDELIEDKRKNYATLLERNCRYFTEFTKGEFLLREISSETINNYDRFLRNKKRIGETTIGMMMSRTRTIINLAVKKRLVKYDVSPFAYYSIKSSPVRLVDITIDNLNKIRKFKPEDKRLQVAKDCFMLSFYLGGINLSDLLEIDFRGGDKIDYIRNKAVNLKRGEQKIVIAVHEEAKFIVKRWMNKNTGKLDFGYKLSYSNFYRYLSRSLNIIAEQLDINQKLVYYSATWYSR